MNFTAFPPGAMQWQQYGQRYPSNDVDPRWPPQQPCTKQSPLSSPTDPTFPFTPVHRPSAYPCAATPLSVNPNEPDKPINPYRGFPIVLHTDPTFHQTKRSATTSTKRAAQNRAAQRAFRKRQGQYVKDLENKAEELIECQLELEVLVNENRYLKQSLLVMKRELDRYKAQCEHAPTPKPSSSEGSGEEAITAIEETSLEDGSISATFEETQQDSCPQS